MIVMQNGVEAYLLVDGAHCEADDYKRDPKDIEKCPMGYDTCTGDCPYYSEENITKEDKQKL